MQLASQDEVRAALEPYHAAIQAIIDAAFSRWLDLKPEDRAALSHPRCRANVIWGFIRDEALKRFAGDPKIRSVEKSSTIDFYLGDLRFRFKKLSDSGRARNYKTVAAVEFYDQLRLELPGYEKPITNLFVGYVLNPTSSGIKKLMVSCPDGDATAWSYEIRDAEPTVLPIATLQPAPKPSPRTRIRPKGVPNDATDRKFRQGSDK